MRQVRQILIKTGAIGFLLFFSVLSVYGQGAIRLVIPIISPACFNGIDDDSDGLLDYPDDTDCVDQNDESEHHLTATCSVSATTVTLGQPATWTVTPLGGSTTYTYSWSGTEVAGNTQNIAVTYSSIGDKTASVTVTSGPDSLVVNCADAVTVISTDVTPGPASPSSGGGGGTSGGLFLLPVSPLPVFDTPSTISEIPTTDTPIKLDSAPEEDEKLTQISPPKKLNPRVRIKIPVRLTLREEGRVVFTNEPIPLPPRTDSLPLFDVISELDGAQLQVTNGGLLGKVSPGELLPVSVKLLNMTENKKRLDVQLNYSITSTAGEKVYSSSETVAVETTASFVKMLQVPYFLVPGTYVVKVNMKYDGQIVPATSHFPFTVEKKILGIFQTTLILYTLGLTVALIFITTIGLILRKKYHQVSRASPLDYSDVPANMRTFYEILSDTIMDMRQRVGDQAIIIANSIDGLKIDPDSGKVLSISENPSKIIAELVSKYEVELGKKVSFLFRHKTK